MSVSTLAAMVYNRKINAQIGTYNAPSLFALSVLACVLNVDESFDSEIHALGAVDRTLLLCRLLSSSAAVN
jgi:hypothetical protein